MLFNLLLVLGLLHLGGGAKLVRTEWGEDVRTEWHQSISCEVVDAINFIKTFGRSATPDHFNTTIDRLWTDTMTSSDGVYGKAMNEVIFDLMRLDRFYFIDVLSLYYAEALLDSSKYRPTLGISVIFSREITRRCSNMGAILISHRKSAVVRWITPGF